MASSSKKDKEYSKSKRWYVIQAFAGFENYVAETLQERIRLGNLQEKFGQIIVPKEKVLEMFKGQKRKSERKFFPGYVFVQVIMDDEAWHLVKSIPRVKGFIGGTSDRPMPIADKDMEVILERIKEGVDKPRPKVLFEPGEVVRVIDGPFADFNGVVEDVNYEKSRLRVSVLIFGRSTPVELEFGQVEKA
ncbi:MAG: transcription termination/antitermination protein NusG [Gammaproteobacteria bacterium]